MSYVVDNYYRNFRPVFYEGSALEPVPGWGVVADVMAGPRIIGIGQTEFKTGNIDWGRVAIITSIAASALTAVYLGYQIHHLSKKRATPNASTFWSMRYRGETIHGRVTGNKEEITALGRKWKSVRAAKAAIAREQKRGRA